MRKIDAHALERKFRALEKQFGVGACGDGIALCINALQEEPTLVTEINKGLEAFLNKMWTPCEEGTPKEMEDVLVWYEYFSYKRNKMVRTYGIGHVYKDFWCGDVQGERAKCIAWMPLPEPYRECETIDS